MSTTTVKYLEIDGSKCLRNKQYIVTLEFIIKGNFSNYYTQHGAFKLYRQPKPKPKLIELHQMEENSRVMNTTCLANGGKS